MFLKLKGLLIKVEVFKAIMLSNRKVLGSIPGWFIVWLVKNISHWMTLQIKRVQIWVIKVFNWDSSDVKLHFMSPFMGFYHICCRLAYWNNWPNPCVKVGWQVSKLLALLMTLVLVVHNTVQRWLGNTINTPSFCLQISLRYYVNKKQNTRVLCTV